MMNYFVVVSLYLLLLFFFIIYISPNICLSPTAKIGANMKNKKNMKKTRRESSISSLPPELLEEILLEALAASPTPIKDIRYFRQTCKDFHATCSSKRVGKYMNVEDWIMYYLDKPGYIGFLQSCAKSENVNALFLLGLEKMFNLRRFDIGLHYLQLATSQGHILAKYIWGLYLFHDESTRLHAIDLLNEVSNNIHHCRKLASQIFRNMIWQKWPSSSFIRCEDLSCGTSALEGDNLWLHEELVKRRFCSDLCKWAHEYKMFVNIVGGRQRGRVYGLGSQGYAIEGCSSTSAFYDPTGVEETVSQRVAALTKEIEEMRKVQNEMQAEL
ncbi:hypothetical protein IEQ34_007447 [Dendrobium chrysotoxum]|uniref:At2g35280-like TPR domain-containing protein n=1 Tax=Dendrobium chrysotoxum TaxID=161865 RepID=A0AAV7H7U2_DENCH|nr:hypothetical protein IEQ34_007447 [Dendrobium chrysotoxum]